MNGANARAGSFGALLRRYRGALGLTQEELAERAGLHAQEISKLERGVLQSPHSTTVEFLARALKLDPRQTESFVVAASGQPQRDETRAGSSEADTATGRVRHRWTLDRRFVAALLGLQVVLVVIGFTVEGAWHWGLAAATAASSMPPSSPGCVTAGQHQACWATVASAGSDQGGPCHGQVPLYLRGGGHMCLPAGDMVEVTCYFNAGSQADGDAVQDHVEEVQSGRLRLPGHIPNRFVDLAGNSPSAAGLPTCLTLRLAAASTVARGQ
jgi:transcriptional regulator with XRE-family HTH domain